MQNPLNDLANYEVPLNISGEDPANLRAVEGPVWPLVTPEQKAGNSVLGQ